MWTVFTVLCDPLAQQYLQVIVCSLDSGMLKGFLIWTARLRSFHNFFAVLLWGLWIGHSKTASAFLFFFHHSLVNCLVCWGLFCCMTHFLFRLSPQTDVRIFFFRVSWYNSEFIFASVITICPGLGASKEAKTKTKNIVPVAFWFV